MKEEWGFKNFIMGFLACYTVLVTAYAVMMHTGRIASISQACVERVGVVPQDYVTQLEKRQ